MAAIAGTAQLVLAACAFGNSVTLPLVFLAALLPAAEALRATGCAGPACAVWIRTRYHMHSLRPFKQCQDRFGIKTNSRYQSLMHTRCQKTGLWTPFLSAPLRSIWINEIPLPLHVH